MELRVSARRGTENSHNVGIYASFQIDIVDEQQGVIVRLHDGQVRYNQQEQRYYILPPARKVGDGQGAKFYRYWSLCPEKEQQEQRGSWENWILEQITAQIPDLNVPAAATQAPAQRQSGPPPGPPSGPPRQAPPQASAAPGPRPPAQAGHAAGPRPPGPSGGPLSGPPRPPVANRPAPPAPAPVGDDGNFPL